MSGAGRSHCADPEVGKSDLGVTKIEDHSQAHTAAKEADDRLKKEIGGESRTVLRICRHFIDPVQTHVGPKGGGVTGLYGYGTVVLSNATMSGVQLM